MKKQIKANSVKGKNDLEWLMGKAEQQEQEQEEEEEQD